VEVLTADRGRWVDTMLREEHGVQVEGPVPISAAAATFVAFLVIGTIPLLPFFVDEFASGLSRPFLWSAVLTAVAFVGVGAAKGLTLGGRVWRAAGETLVVGGLAATAAWVVGYVLKGIADGA